MNQSAEINELAAALAKAQAAVQPAAKDGKNLHFRSAYSTLSSVWDACREPLTSNGIAVVQLPVDGDPERCTVQTTLMHSSGQWVSSTASVRVAKNDPQGYGSALTYLKRYMLASAVGVAPGDDDDGHAASRPPPQAKPQAKPQANGDGKRAKMVERIGNLEQKAARIGLDCQELHQEIMGETRVADATEEQLVEYGKALNALMPDEKGA